MHEAYPLNSSSTVIENFEQTHESFYYAKSKDIAKYVTTFFTGIMVGNVSGSLITEAVKKVTPLMADQVPLMYAGGMILIIVPTAIYSCGILDNFCRKRISVENIDL